MNIFSPFTYSSEHVLLTRSNDEIMENLPFLTSK